MKLTRLLVFGATGTQGHPVLEAALEAGLSVRAATRDLDEAEEKLPGRVEMVRADLLDAEEVQRAAEGMDAIFFHLPVMPDEPDADLVVDNVLAAARRANVGRVVFTTGGYCGDDMPPGVFVDSLRRLSERVLSSGVPAVVLRPTLYLANLVWPHITREIREYGRLTYPPLDAAQRLNWTSTEDQGRIVVACLRADVAGEAIDVASPEALTGPDLCRLLAEVYGREVHFSPQTIDGFADSMSHLAGSGHVGHLLAGLYEGYASLEEGPLVDTDALQHRLGVELTPVSRWVRDRLGYLLSLYG
ncbi:SDR family oxidoreductase [Wenzhouxiangella sp. EGI_FJ10305]|uniref:SDR family oxidoreductase n=1 Tax=Wenzhouxiangella sp. EGI_FJ10305 TaxID=3243768 RepID=UPI0035D771EF